MGPVRLTALVLTLMLLAACGAKTITSEEAAALALEKIQTDCAGEYSALFEDQITCEYLEREGVGYYRVRIPGECACHTDYPRTFTVMIEAETGRPDEYWMTK